VFSTLCGLLFLAVNDGLGRHEPDLSQQAISDGLLVQYLAFSDFLIRKLTFLIVCLHLRTSLRHGNLSHKNLVLHHLTPDYHREEPKDHTLLPHNYRHNL
jgi:hypothetical protein